MQIAGPQKLIRTAAVAVAAGLLALTACGSSETSGVATDLSAAETAPTATAAIVPTTAPAADTPVTETPVAQATTTPATSSEATTENGAEPTAGQAEDTPAAVTSTFTAEIWADNWFALHIDGVLVGEDSVPITTERSFNMETITFEATYPFTIAIEAKDFKETDSGIEYIGERNQQMGDGGLIAQFTNNETGVVVATTSGDWQTLVTHAAPLNKECEKDADPDATCEFAITAEPEGWQNPVYDDTAWTPATEWSEAAVSPKDGYDQVGWDPSAQLIWGSDLETDNTILVRTVVTAP